MAWDISHYKNGALLHIKVQTNTKKNGLLADAKGLIQLRVTASPMKGAANEACIKLLSRFFKIPKSRITFVRGLRSKEKYLWFHSIDPTVLIKVLDSEL